MFSVKKLVLSALLLTAFSAMSRAQNPQPAKDSSGLVAASDTLNKVVLVAWTTDCGGAMNNSNNNSKLSKDCISSGGTGHIKMVVLGYGYRSFSHIVLTKALDAALSYDTTHVFKEDVLSLVVACHDYPKLIDKSRCAGVAKYK